MKCRNVLKVLHLMPSMEEMDKCYLAERQTLPHLHLLLCPLLLKSLISKAGMCGLAEPPTHSARKRPRIQKEKQEVEVHTPGPSALSSNERALLDSVVPSSDGLIF